ncbi:AAA family ATPase [Mesorhizobium sp. M1A.F.Ca.ET.072.01.1.1]|uniref:AAA family ATPase n=1 Tax=Mesorhizobium sp. M1A.F.Ca.ET.072.01.1.1 TaxID=2496753 RepID=UPI000FD1EFD8|nr:AAA family ATPase [Mesorhizobium sp. M1A.F.Ca.ET.072.01.1.1]RUW55613.1 AAA family ATPase [Mesorhizobium sp. M1A.F.Ca.ET.072.01.1.1]
MKPIEKLENALGDPATFIVSTENISLLREWAKAVGKNPVDVAVMTPVQLANLYHARAGNDNSLNEMFVRIMRAVQVPGWNTEIIRLLCKEEIDNLHIETVAERVARLVMIPRRIEISSPTGSTVLNGPVHYMTEKIIKIASRGHPIMMVGPAGCGKTSIGRSVATALNLPFYITSTINEEHHLTGFIDGYGHYHRTPFRNAFEGGGVWVADEIDAWDASALLAANAALANGFAVFPDNPAPVNRHPDFRMVATANTYGSGADRIYIGRNELDAASLDRFATLNVDYDLTLEQLLSNGNQRWLERVWGVRKKVNEKKIRHVVSTRAIIFGADALAHNVATWDECEDIYLFKGMSKSDREKCE